jgi:4-carboxymuconolactone decarboxylase
VARLPHLDREDAEPDVRALLERLPPLGIFSMVANAQGSFTAWARYGGKLLDPDLFDARLRELAILTVARLTPGAEYEWIQHVAIAEAVGASAAEIEAVKSGELGGLEPHARLIVSFTTQVVERAAPDDTTLAARRERHSTSEIIQLLLVIGQYMTVGRIMATSQLDLDPALGDRVIDVAGGAAD